MSIIVRPLRDDLVFGCRINGVTAEDNCRMIHRVTGCTPPHPRSIYRTTIRGDYGLGRFENNDKGRYKELERTV